MYFTAVVFFKIAAFFVLYTGLDFCVCSGLYIPYE